MRPVVVPLFSLAVVGLIVMLVLRPQQATDPGKTGISVAPSANSEAAELSPTNPGNPELAELAAQLAVESRERKALQQQVEQLAAQVEVLARAPATPGQAPRSPAARTEIGVSGWFDEQALVDAGVDAAEARRIRMVYEEQELERLYIRDQAIREGWNADTQRAAYQALASRQQSLRAELDAAAYDAYLYATRQPNRVEVRGVLSGSAAAQAGIQEGDYIVNYNEQRIYSGQELRAATARGETDEVVAVTIQRGDTLEQVYIPRGPLGIRMNAASVPPVER